MAVLSYCHPKDIVRVSGMSTYYHNIACHKVVWQPLVASRFPYIWNVNKTMPHYMQFKTLATTVCGSCDNTCTYKLAISLHANPCYRVAQFASVCHVCSELVCGACTCTCMCQVCGETKDEEETVNCQSCNCWAHVGCENMEGEGQILSTCRRCERSFCIECERYNSCQSCMEAYCSRCCPQLDSCEACEEDCCESCGKTSCDICKSVFCSDCNVMEECSQCGKHACDDCITEMLTCDECGYLACGSCNVNIQTCAICDGTICVKCDTMWCCEVCDEQVCKGCKPGDICSICTRHETNRLRP